MQHLMDIYKNKEDQSRIATMCHETISLFILLMQCELKQGTVALNRNRSLNNAKIARTAGNLLTKV